MITTIPASLEALTAQIQDPQNNSSRGEQERVVVYTRLSRVDQVRPGMSMEIQPDRAEEFARSKGWKIMAVYADPDYSGRNSRRPEFQRMVKSIKAGQVDILVIHRLDRLFRNLESLLKFLRMLKRYNVRLVSVTEQIDSDNWWGRLVLYVLGALAEMYVWQTSERTREAKSMRISKGLPNGNYYLGYCRGLCSTCNDPNGPGYCPLVGNLDRPESERGRIQVPHPIEQHAVRLIVHLYNQGRSDKEIAHYLNTHEFSLPDGQEVRFRTKGIPGFKPPQPFGRESIREIVRSPFYIGQVAHYPTKPLDMEDDPENPHYKSGLRLIGNRREALYREQGLHQPLYPVALWEQNLQIRKTKGTAPTNSSRPRSERLLTGVAKCWECYDAEGREASLRGSTNGSQGKTYYRCGWVQETVSSRPRGRRVSPNSALAMSGLSVTAKLDDGVIDKHHMISEACMNDQIESLLDSFQIPEAWEEQILAFYFSDEGMSAFERQTYNTRQELTRLTDLYIKQFITPAQFEQRATVLQRTLQGLNPTASPEAGQVRDLLVHFPRLWSLMNDTERRAIIKVFFQALYFDGSGRLKKALTNAPFDQLLDFSKLQN